MTRMTRPDCAVMCNLINIHTHTHTHILYNIINCHARVSHKHRIHGKPGLQLCLQKKQNAPRPCEFATYQVTTSRIGWVFIVVVFFTLTDRASTISSNIRGCQSGTWSQRGTKVNGSHHGDKKLCQGQNKISGLRLLRLFVV